MSFIISTKSKLSEQLVDYQTGKYSPIRINLINTPNTNTNESQSNENTEYPPYPPYPPMGPPIPQPEVKRSRNISIGPKLSANEKITLSFQSSPPRFEKNNLMIFEFDE